MSRRDRVDPETARLVEERLQWLLSENGPDSVPAGSRTRKSERVPDDERPAPESRATGAAGPDRPVRAAPTPNPLLATVAGFRRPHLVIVAVVVALGILLSGWVVLRARPVAVAVTPPALSSSGSGPTEPTAAGGATPSAIASSVIVHVLGAVREPGLVTLAAGSRVQDALDAAGGLTGKADPGQLNLAQPVADGQQIVVGTKRKPSGEVRDGSGVGDAGSSGSTSGSASGGGSAGGAGQPVNLNSATQVQLEELPGVGPVMAGKIIAWRTEHGRFSRVEELQEIDGVGPKTYAKLAPLCQV
jgi:competence protein ComEA